MSAVLLSQANSIDRVPVASSNVEAVGYADDFQRLFVWFKNGSLYAYEGVPADVWRGFLGAPSKGQYVYYILRKKGTDSVYPFTPVVRPA